MYELTDRLQGYIEKKISYLESAEVSGLKCLNNGWESDVYAFTLDFVDRGTPCNRQLILRLYTGHDVPLFPCKPLNEFNVLRQLCADGYPVPEVYLLECDSTYLGSPFIIMERIEGEGLDKVARAVAPIERAELLKLNAELFVALHDLDWRKYPATHEAQDVSVIQQEITRHAGVAEHFGAYYALAGLDWLRGQAAEITREKLALAHWDYHPGNVLLTQSKQPIVIDWTVSAVTDYRFDLAWSLLFLGDAADDFVTLYEEASGEKVEHIEFFVAFACLRRILTMIVSMEQGSEALGMRPGAEVIIRQQKGHLQAVYAKWLEITKQRIPHVEGVIASM